MVKNVQSLQAQEFEKKKLNKNKSNKYSAQFWEFLWLSFPSLLFFSFTLSKALTLNTPHQIILYDKMRSFKFFVGSLLCSKRFFTGYYGFPLYSKTIISKFQFDQESGRLRLDMLPPIIFIYLFNF